MRVHVYIDEKLIREALSAWLKARGIEVRPADIRFRGGAHDSVTNVSAEVNGPIAEVMPKLGVYR